MKITNSTPKKDGFMMPAEFSPHQATIIAWPEREGSWIYGAKNARIAFANVIKAICENETVFVTVSKTAKKSAEDALKTQMELKRVEIIELESDDAWARDIAPTFVTNGKLVRGVDWQFNAWGGEFNGLYKNWQKDNAFASSFCDCKNFDFYDAQSFVLEGGSIHSDGEGTIVTTEACLLSKGRNPNLSQAEIEENLKDFLGAKKIIWLKNGIFNDETDEHVDNMFAFTAPGEVVLAWTDDKSDPQYKFSKDALDELEKQTDALGRKFVIRKLPIPKKPVCITDYELKGYCFEDGEDEREVGERLAASYANFYVCNNAVIVPQFEDENDLVALQVLAEAFPSRKIIPIYARDIIVGGGNIHCITQQIPKGDKK